MIQDEKQKNANRVYFAYVRVIKYFGWISYIKFYSKTLSGAKY